MKRLAVFLPLSMTFLSGCFVKEPALEEERHPTVAAASFLLNDATRDVRRDRALKTRAAYELGCTGEIELQPVGAGAYVASGCEDYVTLVCSEPARGTDAPTCVREK